MSERSVCLPPFLAFRSASQYSVTVQRPKSSAMFTELRTHIAVCAASYTELSPMTFKSPSTPSHLNSMQWQQALAVSRDVCARVFRDGGTPRMRSRRSG